MKPILLVRSGEPGEPGDAGPETVLEGGSEVPVEVLLTHRVEALPDGLQRFARSRDAATALVLTSPTSVRVLAGAGLLGVQPSVVWVVGEGTRRALAEALGPMARVLEAHLPARSSAEGLLEALPPDLSGQRFLWPHPEDASPRLAEEMEARGAAVEAPAVYRKVPRADVEPAVLRRLEAGEFGALAVTAPSAGMALLHLAGRACLARMRVVAMGETTAARLRELGLTAVVTAARSTLEGLLAAAAREAARE